MPPEWAPHEATWMGFPRDSYKDSGLTRETAQRAWARVANHISDYERVRMLCHSDDLAIAKQYLSAAIECIPVALNDAWLRDIGPTFVVEEGALLAIDWQFNGWAKIPSWIGLWTTRLQPSLRSSSIFDWNAHSLSTKVEVFTSAALTGYC